MSWTIQDSKELYNIEGWGIGYFDINAAGHVTVHPTRDPDRGLDLFEMAMDLQAQGVSLPLLLRFTDILQTRIAALAQRFQAAIAEFEYQGGYTTVYPVKVNQQRHVVEEIVALGHRYGVGLEVGSKPELQAVLALTERNHHVIVCNGYKDEEFIRLALAGQKLGHQVFIVIEKMGELATLLKVADQMGVQPVAGVRVKLSTAGAGRWATSAGEKSKFGLNASQLTRIVDELEEAGRLDILKMIHFHLGSQVPDIRYIKQAMVEISRYYVELRQGGVNVEYVDVGGGLGVDYDGTRSLSPASVNYSMQEYANDVIYTMAEACRENELPMPHVISESGRALTAHHALLLVNVIDLETNTAEPSHEITEDMHPLVHDLASSLAEISQDSLREVYHDAVFAREQTQHHFNSGVLNLWERALAERLHVAILNRVAELAALDPEEYEDIVPEVEAALTDRYFCNFSLFQSLPDSWAVDHVFPIMPVHRLDEEPSRRGTLQDITCDSDGRIDRFMGWRKTKPHLEVHSYDPDRPYILGIFLTGAYQEILGDLHNLFGDTNAVHVRLTDQGYELGDIVHGDTVTDVLHYVQYNAQDLITTFRRKVHGAKGLSRAETNSFIAEFIEGLAGYTYLEGDEE